MTLRHPSQDGSAPDAASSNAEDPRDADEVGPTDWPLPSGLPIGAAAGGRAQGQLLDATKQMQETQMSFNLQYLQLQAQMQHENRSYTAVSSIMRTKRGTVRNSISNVR